MAPRIDSGSGPPDDTIVGRDSEIHLLHARLAHARNGHGQLVLIGGPPGIGKTSLVTTFLSEHSSEDLLVLAGACSELDVTPPYGPWSEIVRRYTPDEHLPPAPDPLIRGTGMGGIESQIELFELSFSFLRLISAAAALNDFTPM